MLMKPNENENLSKKERKLSTHHLLPKSKG